jgi:hypothetical protein
MISNNLILNNILKQRKDKAIFLIRQAFQAILSKLFHFTPIPLHSKNKKPSNTFG